MLYPPGHPDHSSSLNSLDNAVRPVISSRLGRKISKSWSHVAAKHSLSILLATQIVSCPWTTLVMRFLLAISSRVIWRILRRRSYTTVKHSLSEVATSTSITIANMTDLMPTVPTSTEAESAQVKQAVGFTVSNQLRPSRLKLLIHRRRLGYPGTLCLWTCPFSCKQST